MLITKYSKIFYIIILSFFSFYINYYYGHLGVYPLDTFLFYDSSVRILNGEIPFKDFWVSTGITIDLIQFSLFKIFGVSFKTYVGHASLMNLLLTLSTFFILRKLKLGNFFSFFYSFILSVAAYPLSGTPFLDHHAIIFCIFAIYIFILSILDIKKYSWVFLPFFLLFAFFSKQTPSGYIIILLGLLTIVFFLHHFNLRSLLSLLTSSLLSLVFVFGLLLINEISLTEIYNQFISYPSFVGEIRMKADGFLTPIEFSRYVLKFKFVHLSYIFLLFYLIKFVLSKENLFLKKDFYILVSLIAFSIVLIFHQLLSLNQKFIDLMVPILLGFSHIYLVKSKDFFKKKFIYIKNFLLLFSLIFLIDIFFNYIDNRRFMDLKKVNLENTVDAINIDKSLKGLRWVTYMYPNNPNKEIDLINETISELKKENKNFFLLTHYSFIHSLVGAKSFNSSRVHDDVSIPLKNDKNFEDYKKKFRGLFAEKKINKIFIISPVNYKSIDGIFPQNCLREKKINKILTSYEIKGSCKKF